MIHKGEDNDPSTGSENRVVSRVYSCDLKKEKEKYSLHPYNHTTLHKYSYG